MFIKKPKETVDVDVASCKDEKSVELLEKHVQNDSVYEKTTLQDDEGAETTIPSLKECIFSSEYLLHVVWLCLLQLRFYYFLGTVNTYITRVTKNDDKLVSYFTNVMMYTMLGGLISSTFSGVVFDWQRRMFEGSRSGYRRKLMPAIFPLILTCGLAILLSVLVLLPYIDILYVVFIVMTLYRSFLYGIGTAYLSALFPGEYFGMLYGIMIISGGIFGFFQFAIFTWSQSSPISPMHADIFCLCVVAVSLIHPFIHWWKCRKAEYKFL